MPPGGAVLNIVLAAWPLNWAGALPLHEHISRDCSCCPSDDGVTAYACSKNGFGVGTVELFARSMPVGTVILTAE